jgi:hypothetical protein
VAVVQISRIQVRRGLKNSNSGVPQLSSGEFAWALDSQELYIGNGAVADGAPYVGNTKILTEHDNILELASSYQFAIDDASISFSVNRSLQSKLDEYVSVADFGAVNDGSTDSVAAFEAAARQLFRNANEDYRKVLFVPNGEYLFSSNLRLPSKTILRGETKDGVILNIGINNILFTTSDGLEIGNFNSSNRPTSINLSNLTISSTTGQLVLTGVADSTIEDVIFESTYRLGDSTSYGDSSVTPFASFSNVFWENTSVGIRATDIVFRRCKFLDSELAVRTRQIDQFETRITFDDCHFKNIDTGIFIDGVSGQTNRWNIIGTTFEEVYSRAININNGQGTLIRDCSFINCGNGANDADTPLVEIIRFTEKPNNQVLDCRFNRHQRANLTNSENLPAVTEVLNAGKVSMIDMISVEVFPTDNFQPASVFSSDNRAIDLEYTLVLGSNEYVRHGTISMTIDNATDQTQRSVGITDSYSYSAGSITAPGGALMTDFEFDARLKDNNSEEGKDTVVLYYRNLTSYSTSGTLAYTIVQGV